MNFIVKEFTESNAIDLCGWTYEEPFEIYNCPNWEEAKKANWGMFHSDIRGKEFFAVYHEDNFVGFFRLVEQEGFIMVGLGLRPDFCGKGYGKQLLKLVKSYANKQHGNVPLRLEVREFNSRAIKCYQKAGFVKIAQSEKQTPSGSGQFIVMECANEINAQSSK